MEHHEAAVAASPANFIEPWLTKNEAQLIALRQHLHQNPELSQQETATTELIFNKLTAAGLMPQRFPGTGCYVDLGPNPTLAIRADIDALAITEQTGLPFSSAHPGKMHACGHDLHTTIALGLALAWAELGQPVPVRIIFQPAEEVMTGGATDVIAWGALTGIKQIVALHAEPKLKTGTIGLRPGPITSAGDVINITLTGPGGHTSRPHLSADLVYALGQLITNLPGMLSRKVDPRTGTVLVFGAVNAGDAANAIPMTGQLRGTVRTAEQSVWEQLEPLITNLVAQIIAPTGCDFTLDYIRGVPPVINDVNVNNQLHNAATAAVGAGGVVPATQSSGGEDFAWYLQKIPGAMARLGCWDGTGTPPDLHRADLIVDDQAIAVGIRLFHHLICHYTK